VIDISVSGHYTGDCRDLLAQLPDGCVQACITSPPYWGLRDYGHEGQLGLEATPELYVAAMVEVFRGVRRVLRDDGTLWLNLGDSYAGSGRGGYAVGKTNLQGSVDGQDQSRSARCRQAGMHNGAVIAGAIGRNWVPPPAGLKNKDLVGIPWMVAFALRADGWYLRSDIIWHKPNPMPESVRDRPTKAHEYLFLLSKSETYYYDADGVKERASGRSSGAKTVDKSGGEGKFRTRHGFAAIGGRKHETRNLRSVWTVATQPYAGAHFATFPPRLIEPCVLAGSRPGDIVLDPFFGSGTTGMVAQQHGRRYIGFDLGYADLAEERLRTPMLPMRGVS
jgi:DNA modification methylase